MIKFVVPEDLSQALGVIFSNISLLMGIKEPISEINKNDIKKLILSHYRNISLEQIVYAFELERYGQLPPKTKHFQLLNAEYVATVLLKFKDWLAKTRFDNNIPLPKQKPVEQKTISEQQKHQILINGAIRCYNEFLENGLVAEGNTHIYEFLFDDLKVHKFQEKEINAAERVAKRQLEEQSKTIDRTKAKSIITEIQNPNSKKVSNLTKRLLLKSYFKSIENKGIQSVLSKQNLQN